MAPSRTIDHGNVLLSILKSTPQFTEKQGQYLAFIYTYALVNRRPPAEADMQALLRSHASLRASDGCRAREAGADSADPKTGEKHRVVPIRRQNPSAAAPTAPFLCVEVLVDEHDLSAPRIARRETTGWTRAQGTVASPGTLPEFVDSAGASRRVRSCARGGAPCAPAEPRAARRHVDCAACALLPSAVRPKWAKAAHAAPLREWPFRTGRRRPVRRGGGPAGPAGSHSEGLPVDRKNVRHVDPSGARST